MEALRRIKIDPLPTIYVDCKDENSIKNYEPAPKTQIKKVQKLLVRGTHKNTEKEQREDLDAANRTQNLEEAKKIIISEDTSLPKAKKINISAIAENKGERVKVYGWVHRLRRQGKALIFITLRDGRGFLQCILSGMLCKTYDALMLTTESSVLLIGTLKILPEGKSVSCFIFKYFIQLLYTFILGSRWC